MKTKSNLFLLSLLLFPIFLSAFPMSQLSTTIQSSYPLNSSPYLGVSNYNITQSVKYRVEINFTLTHNSGVGDYIFKFARLNNRMPNSTLTKYTPPYQESKLAYNSIAGDNIVAIMMDQNDKFNNTYDLFNVSSLTFGEGVSLDQKYVIELNAIKFQDIEDSEIGTYDMSDEIFDLYCNNTEPYYQRDDSDLIILSNSLVSPSDNPVEKAQKICNWVSTNIEYNDNLPTQEMGASWAYDNLEGDCSEYSSLMVTLLRIQDIPARKVTGFVVSNNPRLQPRIGDSWNFYASDSGQNILGHAWLEYYVADIGWIACDPTWHSATNYFNSIDFLRFNTNVGANFFFPPSHTVSEFGNPIFSYFLGDTFNFDYNVKITVLESNLAALPPIPIMLIVFVVIGVAAIVVTVVLLIRRSHKK